MKKGKVSVVIVAIIVIAVVSFITFKALSPNTNQGIVIEKTKIQNIETIDINAKADQLAEKMLIALNSTNYTQYTSQFSESLIVQLPEKGFERLCNLITNTSGRYISKMLVNNRTTKEYNVFAYNASFEKETVTFELHLSNQAAVVEAVRITSKNLERLQNY